MTRSTRRATYQDVLDAPAHRVAEIVDGTLHVSPRPPTLAALAKTRLSAGLGVASAVPKMLVNRVPTTFV